MYKKTESEISEKRTVVKKFLDVRASDIPLSLREINQWVVWQGVWKPEKKKFSKIPYQTDLKDEAKVNDPSTWTSFESAIECYNFNAGNGVDGIGFVLADNGIVGFDFDKCIDDSGKIDPEVERFLNILNSYTEVSPSGKGLRVFTFGKLPKEGRKAGGYECYESGRYLTLTGHRLREYPATIEHREKEIIDVHRMIFEKPDQKAKKTDASFSVKKIEDRLKKAFDAENGSKIRMLYDGKWEEYGKLYKPDKSDFSQSDADFALCGYLASWLNKNDRAMDSAFRKSNLFRPEKWDKKHYSSGETYGQHAIGKAIKACGWEYSDTEKQPRQSASSALIDIGKRADLFVCNEEAYATVSVNDHFETHALNSKAFRYYLTGIFHEENDSSPSKEGIAQALDTLAYIARKNGEKPVFTRIAKADDTVFVDLCNPDYEVVRITASGWEVVREPSIKFIRGSGAEPLPKPERAVTGFADLKKLMNCKGDEDFCLLTAFLVGCFSFGSPYPILCLQGEPGSGKSTKTRMLKRLTDPNKADLRSLPKEIRDLMISAKHNHTLAFDNLSGMPQWLSDAFCRISTGGGFSVRAHYADSDEIIFEAKRPLILNGIEDIADKTDLADRAISVTLEQMSDDSKLEEGVMWAEFERVRPGILGAMFDAVSEALKNYNRIVLTQKNVRMLDFAKWIIAAEPMLPIKSGFFMDSYHKNREDLIENTLQNDGISSSILKFMDDRESWEGIASELLTELRKIADSPEGLPKKANGFSGKLRRVIPFLRKAGVEITIPQGKKRREGKVVRAIYISRIHTTILSLPSKNSESSATSATPPFCDNKQSKKTDTYCVADSVADQPDVADQHRQHKEGLSGVAGQKSDVADHVADDFSVSSTDKKDQKQNVEVEKAPVADVADKSPLLWGKNCLSCRGFLPEKSKCGFRNYYKDLLTISDPKADRSTCNYYQALEN